MYSSIAKNKRNTVVIFTMFVAVISAIGFSISSAYGNPSIFWWTLVGAAIYASIEYFFASKIALAMTGAREISRSDAPEFYQAVDAISITAGIPMPKVYVIDDPSPNAFAAGNSPEKSLVCATTGLLQIMDKAELEGVVAHEISHIKNYDIRVSMMAFALTAAIGMLSDIAWRFIFSKKSDSKDGTNGIAMLIGMILVAISPILAVIIRMAISREREYLADASAVMLTRHPEGMISALEKLKSARPLRRQSSTTANLFITNPLKAGFISGLFATHPPLDKRIERLKENSERF